MTPCPACDKPVDPLRSRFVGVRDGKVVAYCSAVCAGGARPAAPIAAEHAMSPATGVPTRIPTPPAGVPARLQTPATGVPVAPQRASSSVPAVLHTLGDATGGIPRGLARGDATGSGLDSGPVIEIIHEPTSGVVTSARDARTEPRVRHPDEIPIAAFWSADKDRSDAVDGNPGGRAEGRDASEPAGDAATAAAPADGSGAEREASARAPSELGLPLAPRKRRLPILLLVLVLLGGGGFLLYHYLVASGLAAATRLPSAPVAAVARIAPVRAAAPVPPAPAVVDAAAAVERARQALQRDLAATSPRVQRLAAAALARTQDAAACALLAAQLGTGGARDPAPAIGAGEVRADDPRTSDIARLDLAYALARGGDRRGSGILAGALGAPRGEARDEAARLLALLGDARAVPHLLDLLAVSQRRLGAAEHLAHLGEPRAIKVLDQLRADPRVSAGDRARATVALGIAGRSDVAGALRDMLGDAHFNAFAAAALAALKDRSARPVLERQLGSPPLRVLAARALRRLEPALDARPLLPALLDVVRVGRDIERIPAAEAILLLAGPERWSAYD